mmetsp:Transcript_9403/g.27618  ORF Transcript_9403/g.27618 Transcript_9403/m.27618 type:complete len:349 (+) Transcript_9403:3964-5010(+)
MGRRADGRAGVPRRAGEPRRVGAPHAAPPREHRRAASAAGVGALPRRQHRRVGALRVAAALLPRQRRAAAAAHRDHGGAARGVVGVARLRRLRLSFRLDRLGVDALHVVGVEDLELLVVDGGDLVIVAEGIADADLLPDGDELREVVRRQALAAALRDLHHRHDGHVRVLDGLEHERLRPVALRALRLQLGLADLAGRLAVAGLEDVGHHHAAPRPPALHGPRRPRVARQPPGAALPALALDDLRLLAGALALLARALVPAGLAAALARLAVRVVVVSLGLVHVARDEHLGRRRPVLGDGDKVQAGAAGGRRRGDVAHELLRGLLVLIARLLDALAGQQLLLVDLHGR